MTPQAHYYHFSRSWKFLLVASVTWERLVSSTLNTTGHFLLQGCLEVGPQSPVSRRTFQILLPSAASGASHTLTDATFCQLLSGHPDLLTRVTQL